MIYQKVSYYRIVIIKGDRWLIKTYKIILIGDPSVGKTSLRKRYMGEGFKTSHQVTIGADFAIKRVTNNGELFLFQIWDLSSQVAFKSIRQIYYKNTDGIILTFDLTSKESLSNLPLWLTEFMNSVHFTNIPGLIVGNKSDLPSSYEQPNPDLLDKVFADFEKKIGRKPIFYKTSALNGTNVETMFNSLIDALLEEKNIKY